MKVYHHPSLEIIPFSNITRITKNVTEQISQKYLKSFLITTINQENLPKTKTSKIIYQFIEKSNSYEIYLFQTKHKKALLEFQLFEKYQNSLEDFHQKYQLFITHTFFTLYFDGKFISAIENKNYTTSDIIKFVQFNYKITIDEIIEVSDEEMKKLKQHSSNLQSFHFTNLQSSYESYYFLFYLVVILLASLYYYNINYNTSTKNPLPNSISEQPYENQKIASHITQTITHLHHKNIKLEDLNYNKKLFLKVKSTHQNLYDFLAIYKKNMKIIKLEKIEDNLIFAEVEIEF